MADTPADQPNKGPLFIRVRISASFPLHLVPNAPSTLLADNKPLKVLPGQAIDISFAASTFTIRSGEGTWTAHWIALTPDEAPPSIVPSRVHGVTANNKTTYRARLEALIYGGTPYLVNVVPMNDYLYGVLGSEMPVSWPLESLKAQAVAARTYALFHLLYREPTDPTPWDVCDTTDCQAYFGTRKESPTVYEAVRLTDREVLVYAGRDVDYSGRLIDAVFHSTSPGRTYNSEDVWTTARPYLRSRDDSAYSRPSPWYQWSRNVSISIPTLAALLGMKQITSLTPLWQSGEARKYVASGGGVTRSFTKEQLRAWFHMPSPSFDLKATNGKLLTQTMNPGMVLTTVNGRGFGHGVGLSQYGAKTMAEQGWGYTRILDFYYTDIDIKHYNLSGMRWPKGYPGN